MLFARAVDAQVNASSLAWYEAAAIFIGIPLLATAAIFWCVNRFTTSRPHEGFQVLGHPANLQRHERDSPGGGRPAVTDEPAAGLEAAAQSTAVGDAELDEPADDSAMTTRPGSAAADPGD